MPNPKRYPDELKKSALNLYLSGTTNGADIARKLKKQYPTELKGRDTESIRKNLVSRQINLYKQAQALDPTINKSKALEEECEAVGIPLHTVGNYWYKGEHFSIHADPRRINYEFLRDELIEEMKEYSPKYPKIKRTKTDEEEYLLVIDPADIHIGKLSEGLLNNTEYNSQIAVDRVFEGVRGILRKARGYKIDKILFVAGNDVLHIDSPSRKTANNTPQDTDGMWYSNYLIAKKLYIDILEILMQVADVHVVFNPSNHDFTNGFFLCDAVKTWFSKSKNITFDADIRHRKYFRYFSNLIGTSHGDGAKPQDLPLLMANEAKEDWGQTKHYYVYVHHLHHKHSKDYGAVCVEGLRSPSGTDYWHHKGGYQGAPKAIEGFIHSKTQGQVGRFTHIF